jgi:hypothetical protein
MPPMIAQSVPVDSVLAAPATAVLGLIAVLLVVALVATLRALIVARRNGNGHEETPAEAIAKSIAVIEREGIDLPRNWRDFVDARIRHHDRNRRAVVLAYVHLLERGQNEQVIRLLRDEADED